MTWAKFGDTWADDPRLLATLGQPGADDRTLNEVRGFISTLAGESAKYNTDYVLNHGQVVKAAGSVGRAEPLTAMCVAVGLLERVDAAGMPGVKLVEDPDFIHLIKKAEADWNRQRKRDNADPNLKWPIIGRDGDHCRWCRHEVHWTGKMSNRKATLDHLQPGEAGTVETMVVACMACNSARRDDEDGSWSSKHPLLPVPETPYWGTWSRQQLAKRGLLPPSDSTVDAAGPDQAVAVVPALGTPPVSPQPAVARPLGLQDGNPGAGDHGAPAGSATEEAAVDAGPDGGREYRRCDPVHTESASSSGLVQDSVPPESGLPGTGRDSGRDGSGPGRDRAGTGPGRGGTRGDSPPPARDHRRRRRGGRRR